jgi:hypothetical protein
MDAHAIPRQVFAMLIAHVIMMEIAMMEMPAQQTAVLEEHAVIIL